MLLYSHLVSAKLNFLCLLVTGVLVNCYHGRSYCPSKSIHNMIYLKKYSLFCHRSTLQDEGEASNEYGYLQARSALHSKREDGIPNKA